MTNRKIIVPAGIGDNIWLLNKLINTGERFDFYLPDGRPQRGHQIFHLLPMVTNSVSYISGIGSYKKIKEQNIQAKPGRSNWADIVEGKFYLTANEWLEAGKRIEGFLPDLDMTYQMPWQTDRHVETVDNIIRKDYGTYPVMIGIYTSAYDTVRSWGFWDEHKWLELIMKVREVYPWAVFVIIGADWDIDLNKNLMKLLEDKEIPYIKVIGEHLGVVVEFMKLLKYFFSFPSGLGILADSLNTPLTMFYPPHLEKMINAWAQPEHIKDGTYKGCLFCEPQQIFDWVIENDKL